MELNDFANDLGESANFLIDKLLNLHPWDEKWDFKTACQLVPFYKEQMDLKILKDGQCSEEDFDKIIRLSSILDTNKVKLLFIEELKIIPMILDDKFLNTEERIDLLMESLNGRIKKIANNKYLFFNHEVFD